MPGNDMVPYGGQNWNFSGQSPSAQLGGPGQMKQLGGPRTGWNFARPSPKAPMGQLGGPSLSAALGHDPASRYAGVSDPKINVATGGRAEPFGGASDWEESFRRTLGRTPDLTGEEKFSQVLRGHPGGLGAEPPQGLLGRAMGAVKDAGNSIMGSMTPGQAVASADAPNAKVGGSLLQGIKNAGGSLMSDMKNGAPAAAEGAGMFGWAGKAYNALTSIPEKLIGKTAAGAAGAAMDPTGGSLPASFMNPYFNKIESPEYGANVHNLSNTLQRGADSVGPMTGWAASMPLQGARMIESGVGNAGLQIGSMLGSETAHNELMFQHRDNPQLGDQYHGPTIVRNNLQKQGALPASADTPGVQQVGQAAPAQPSPMAPGQGAPAAPLQGQWQEPSLEDIQAMGQPAAGGPGQALPQGGSELDRVAESALLSKFLQAQNPANYKADDIRWPIEVGPSGPDHNFDFGNSVMAHRANMANRQHSDLSDALAMHSQYQQNQSGRMNAEANGVGAKAEMAKAQASSPEHYMQSNLGRAMAAHEMGLPPEAAAHLDEALANPEIVPHLKDPTLPRAGLGPLARAALERIHGPEKASEASWFDTGGFVNSALSAPFQKPNRY